MIQRVKADKASNKLKIFNKVLQVSLKELILSLTNLFNVYVTFNRYSKQFKRARIIVLYKLKKSDYIDLKSINLLLCLTS